jgi:hypothetical protein
MVCLTNSGRENDHPYGRRLLDNLVEQNIDILRVYRHRIFLVVAGHVAGGAGNGVAVFVEADGDGDLAGERHALHHNVVLTQRVIERKSRPVDFFNGERRAAGAAGAAGNDEQCGVRIDPLFEFWIDGDLAADLCR